MHPPGSHPQFITENALKREFTVDTPNEKWLTDVTEYKWYDENKDNHKVYLSAILDLYDRRSIAYVISDRNDNPEGGVNVFYKLSSVI